MRVGVNRKRNCVRTVSHAPRTAGKHRDLRGHGDAHRCREKSLFGSALVGFGVRQHARAESISKRAQSTTLTSLRLESITCLDHLRPFRMFEVDLQARWIVAPCGTGGALTALQRTSFRSSEESVGVQPANSFLAIHRASLARCGPSTSDPATAPSNSTIRARAVAFASFTPAAVVHSRKRSANHAR